MGALLGVITGVTMEPHIGRELEAGDNVLEKTLCLTKILWKFCGGL